MKHGQQLSWVKCLIVLFALSGFGCVNAHRADSGSRDYSLMVTSKGGYLTVKLGNNTNSDFVSGGLFLVMARGSAGLYLGVIDTSGKAHPMCGMIDQAAPNDGRIHPGGVLVAKISLSAMKEFYCLEPGKYLVSATFAVARPSSSPEIVAKSVPTTMVIK